jgi:hypothetical protein
MRYPFPRVLALAVVLGAAGCSKEAPTTGAPAGGPSATATAQPQPSMPADHPMPAAPSEAVDLTGIAPAEGGKTIAEVYTEKAGLAGKPVSVRGKVVKVNASIMDRNWIHVRDGSGAEGTNDLTVTTTGTPPAVGDTVLVTGPVILNKDFGMGYEYDVMIEDAEVKVEPAG